MFVDMISAEQKSGLVQETGRIQAPRRVNIELRDLCVELCHRSPLTLRRVSSTRVLDSVNANFFSGEMTAVMGASGSGKTSLLDALAGRATKGGKPEISGEVLINGDSVDPAAVSQYAAYVTQTDRLCPELSVRETLVFAASLHVSRADQASAVRSLTLDLGLDMCASTRVGGGAGRSGATGNEAGISGGERRRLTIALQLLRDPPLLLLDEPTSGLDSTSADRTVRLLRRLAQEQGRTIVCSTHQPSAKSFAAFDRVLLLSRGGRVAFEGKRRDAEHHFVSLGFTKPKGQNPADFIVDVTTGHVQRTEAKRPATPHVERLRAGEHKVKSTHRETPCTSRLPLPRRANTAPVGLIRQTCVLLHREALTTWRNKHTALGFLVQSLLIGVFIGWIFYKPGDSPAAVQVTKKAVLYLSAANQPYITLVFALYTACNDFAIFDQERADGLYRPSAYVIAHYLAHLPIHVLSPALYYSIIYGMVGLRSDAAWHPIVNISCGILAQNTAVALAWLCAAIWRAFDRASLAGNFLYTFTVLAGGFVVSLKTLPPWISWWKYISFQGYTFEIFAINEFHNHEYVDGNTVTHGDAVIEGLGFGTNMLRPLLYLFLVAVSLQLAAFLLLIFVPHPPGATSLAVPAAKRRSVDVLKSERKISSLGTDEPDDSQLLLQTPGPSVAVENITVTVASRDATRWWTQADATALQETRVLNDISAKFPAGRLTVVLGPSGSGKTTLLSVIGGRCAASLDISGTVLINEHAMFGSSRGMVSSMAQNPSLLPALTVSETIVYSARLANIVSDPVAAATQVQHDLGLDDCSSNLVALCSGGECRRTAIATYLVARPAILLLDEPTTGLDAAGAVDLVQTLHRLRHRFSTTIIASIHQPRPELFAQFGNLILMARGSLVYAGPARRAVAHVTAVIGDAKRAPDTSAPELLLDLLSPTEQSDLRRLDALIYAWKTRPPVARDSKGLALQKRPRLGFFAAYRVLLSRELTNFWRQPVMIMSRFMQIISFGLVLSLYFWQLGTDQVSIINRMNVLWEMNALVFVGMLNCAATFPPVRDVFYRERADGTYSTVSFFAAYCSIELPFGFVCSYAFCLMLTYATGLDPAQTSVIQLTTATFLVVTFGESVGIVYCAIFRHVGFALSLISINLGLTHITAGFLTSRMPPVVDSLFRINPLRYSGSVMVNTEFDGRMTFSCDPNQMAFSTCLDTADDVKAFYGFSWPTGRSFGVLVCLCVGYRLVAFGSLKFVPHIQSRLTTAWHSSAPLDDESRDTEGEVMQTPLLSRVV